MTMTENNTYFDLTIQAQSDDCEIWLGDDKGFFVQKGTGFLETSLLPGSYTVEFGLGNACYSINLQKSTSISESEITLKPAIKRPTPDV